MFYITELLEDVMNILKEKGYVFANSLEILYPSREKFGDLSTNLALKNAKANKLNPREFAKVIIDNIKDTKDYIEDIKIEGPGFINFYFNKRYYKDRLEDLYKMNIKEKLIRKENASKSILIEFVSANPTGPLNIVNARAACFGDIISEIYKLAGYKVYKEFYVNDWGGQIEKLIDSVIFAINKIKGNDTEGVNQEDLYKGDYIFDIAKELIDLYYKDNDKYDRNLISKFALSKILKSQQQDLKDIFVEFDNWYKQTDLLKDNLVFKVVDRLEELDYVYNKDGALWFKSSLFGDDKDRVLIRKNGMPTYFAFDIAYHYSKIKRGFNYLLDYLGPDHHGYINRLKAGIKALGFKVNLYIDIIQLVTLIKNNKKLRMSKREGNFITIKELLNEINSDIVRYFFTSLTKDTHLNFDVELALLKSEDNPLYYIQYAYARISSLIDKVNQEKGEVKSFDFDYNSIDSGEISLLKKLEQFFVEFEKALQEREVSYLNRYFYELSSMFHSYYSKNRILAENKDKFLLRYKLILTIRKFLAFLSNIFKIKLPERM